MEGIDCKTYVNVNCKKGSAIANPNLEQEKGYLGRKFLAC